MVNLLDLEMLFCQAEKWWCGSTGVQILLKCDCKSQNACLISWFNGLVIPVRIYGGGA